MRAEQQIDEVHGVYEYPIIEFAHGVRRKRNDKSQAKHILIVLCGSRVDCHSMVSCSSMLIGRECGWELEMISVFVIHKAETTQTRLIDSTALRLEVTANSAIARK